MSNEVLIEKFEKLPDILKSEASLFIDFLIYKSNQSFEHKQRQPGFMKGKISITDDFDEPLEEFQEYM